jgi:exonuclease SbcC
MRLHQIEVQAFGPFAQRQVIDLDALSDSGLFLVHGPTGAGKTSILDAVSFALFGTVPGFRSQGGSLRSHLADPTTPTEVMVEVSFGARRLRITRRPKQQRPKHRGEGFVEDPPKARVEELIDGQWKAIADKPAEVGQLVSDLLRMGVDQFHQVVLLPQGEFARFLRSSAEERRPLLEKLFATDRFAKIESWLDEQRKAAQHALEEASARVDQAVHAIEVVAKNLQGDAALETIPPIPDDWEQLIPWARHILELGGDEARRAGTRASKLRAAREELATAHQSALQLEEHQRRHAEATRRHHELHAERDAHAERLTILQTHERAAPVQPLLTQVERAQQAERSAVDRLATQRRAAEAREPTLAAASAEQVRQRHQQLLHEIGQLSELHVLEREIDERARTLAEHRRELSGLQSELEQISEALAELPEQIAGLESRKEQATRVAGALDGLRRDAADAEKRADAARFRDQLREQLAGVDNRLRAAVDAHQSARDELHRLQDARIADMAAELAATLEWGSPCPVCGSTDHPRPARSTTGTLIRDEQIERARAAVEAAERHRSELEREQTELKAKLAAAQTRAGETPVEELEEQAAAAREAVTDAEQQAAEADTIETQLKTLTRAERDLRERQRELSTAIGKITSAITEVERAQNEGRKRLDDALAGEPTVADAIDRRRQLASACEALAEAIKAAVDAAEQVRRAQREADEGAARAGFASADAARSALLSDERVAELREAVTAYDSDLATVRSVLDDPVLSAAAAEPPVDLAALESELQQADEQLAAAQRHAGALAQTVETLEREVAALEDALAAVRPLIARHDEIARLARLAAGDGDNALRMRLSAFVLAARLEQVAHSASQRLQRMSGGRFSLRHTDEETDGRRRGGLGLLVVDAWSGTERPTSTLSGGETFMASLALALGMADVVTAEAGGTQIDTLFIDEGFGSLDDATLQVVMDVLDDLRSGGRTVGVVSHVADLRSRITAQIAVRKGPHGSSVRQTVMTS